MYFLNKKPAQNSDESVEKPKQHSLAIKLSHNSRTLFRERVISTQESHWLMAILVIFVVGVISALVLNFKLYPHIVTLKSAKPSGAVVLGGINVEPSYRNGVIGLDGWWESCDSNWQTIAQNDMNNAKLLGVTLIRVEFPWIAIQPSAGAGGFNWTSG